MVDVIIKYLLPILTPPLAIIVLLLFIPEKIEKWSALLWKVVATIAKGLTSAHKRYLKHDLQGRVNDFVKHLRKEVPTLSSEKLKIEWVDPAVRRESFIADGQVVLRLRRDDPTEHNFVHAAVLYVSGTLLTKPKRYISPSQREAIDLFVCTKMLEAEKPAVVTFFLDEYLHPKTDDPKAKVALYLDDFEQIDRGSLFFPVLVQELQYLGDKVFGRRRDDLVHTEVNGLIEFLKPIANRRIGDEVDLNFNGGYCKFALVIVGKPAKLLVSIDPYVSYIRNALAAEKTETIYVLARAENQRSVDDICSKFHQTYECVRTHRFRRVLKYLDREETAQQYLAVLRRRESKIIQASTK